MVAFVPVRVTVRRAGANALKLDTSVGDTIELVMHDLQHTIHLTYRDAREGFQTASRFSSIPQVEP